MMIPAAEEQLKFITNIQRILDEGSFVATYKFALIMSLADYAVENGDDSGEPIQLTTRDIAVLWSTTGGGCSVCHGNHRLSQGSEAGSATGSIEPNNGSSQPV
jgi:hypothetical protein